MMSNKQITMKRLQKEELALMKEPIPGVLVKRDGFLNFYFCIYGLDGAYSGGYYFGLLELHENYPFAAPKLFFYTKSGRFQINMSICTSFTSYHQESWTSAWNVRTLILATISFMTSDQPSYGCRNDPSATKKHYAQISLAENLKNEKFVELFGDDIKNKGRDEREKFQQCEEKLEENINSQQVEPSEMIEERVEIERREEMRENLIEEEIRPNEQNNAGRNKIILIALTGIIAASALLCYLIIK